MIRTRFAPSPTGEPHIGNLYTALFNFAFAKKNKGKFILRFEDTDRNRFVGRAEKQIIDSLKWVGFIPDEGPYRQSERLHLYEKYAHQLIETGAAYYCFCSTDRLNKMRQEQQRKHLAPMYDGRCLKIPLSKAKEKIAKGMPFVIRLKVPKSGQTVFKDEVRGQITIDNKNIDDQILLKSDGFPTYHLAVVVDDHLMKISHIIRAEEWLSSVPKHIIIYRAFKWPIPVFIHLPLLRHPDKSKLSKRKNPTSVFWYQQQGFLPQALVNYLALMGFSLPDEKEIFSLDDFIQSLDIQRIVKSGPVFDLNKLTWLNGLYIRNLTNKQLTTRLIEFYPDLDPAVITKLTPLVKERIKTLAEFKSLTAFMFKEKIELNQSQIVIKEKKKQETRQVLKSIHGLLIKTLPWKAGIIHQKLESLRQKNYPSWSKRDFCQLIRLAISGQTITPPLFEIMEILGKDILLRRLSTSQTLIS